MQTRTIGAPSSRGVRRFLDTNGPITLLTARTARFRVTDAPTLDIARENDTKSPQTDESDTV